MAASNCTIWYKPNKPQLYIVKSLQMQIQPALFHSHLAVHWSFVKALEVTTP